MVRRWYSPEMLGQLVALGRAVLADPEWAVKLGERQLAAIRPYDKRAGSVLH